MKCIRIQRLASKLEISRATIYRWLRDDSSFPRSFNIGAGSAVAWDEAEIDSWLCSHKEAGCSTSTKRGAK
jgi:prophage regulatory protein